MISTCDPGNRGNQDLSWPSRLRSAAIIISTEISRAIALGAIVLSLALLPDSSIAEEKRQKVIDFEDELVEGVNRRPLDSLSHLSDAEKKRRKPHLYRKRRGFRAETDETLKVLRYVP